MANRFNRQFGKGYIKDPPHARLLRPLLGVTIAETPDTVSMQGFELRPFDQGAFGSCTGHGTAQAIAVTSKGRLGYVASPHGIYGNGRAVTRTKNGTPYTPLTDSGAYPADVCTGINVFGVRPIGARPADGRWSDIDETNVNVEESLLQIESSSPANGSYRIDETSSAFIHLVRTAGALGNAVCVGVFVDTAFEDYNGSAPIDNPPNFSDPNGGGHWLPITGYTTTNGVTVFNGPNSWGTAWGKEGRFEVTERWLKAACSDCYPITPAV